MPKKLEKRLDEIARRRGYSQRRRRQYVYGTLQKIKKKRKK